jgi:hypothetical protein
MTTNEALQTFKRLQTVSIDTNLVENLEFDYNQTQYPEYEDSCIISASWKNTGKDLTDEELEVLNDDSDFVYESLQDHIY